MISRSISLGILSISVSLGSLAACSDAGTGGISDAGAQLGSSGGNTSVSTHSSGGMGGQGGTSAPSTEIASDAGVTSGCPVFPKEKLFPYIGTRFYGPDPGPCTMQFIDGTTFTYVYDNANRPTRVDSNDGSLDMTFTFDGNLVMREVDVQPAGESICDFQYGSDTASYTYSGATQGYTATYTLDARGYPQTVAITGASSTSWPTRYVYRYNGCQMRDRIAYDADGSENDRATLHYTFDAAGHFVRQVSTDGAVDTTFDYSCW